MLILFFVFFFNDPATTDIYTYRYTLSLHDALPIFPRGISTSLDASGAGGSAGHGAVYDCRGGRSRARAAGGPGRRGGGAAVRGRDRRDRKSTRLNSSH